MKSVGELREAPYNPRKISDPQLERLGKSMKEFGDLSGIVVNVRTGHIISGHQRKRRFDPEWEIKKAPVKDQTGTVALGQIITPWGPWSYREVDWPEKKERLANVAANKHGGEFDFPKLGPILMELDDGDTDMDLTGFDAVELKDIADYTPPDPGGGDGGGGGGGTRKGFFIALEFNDVKALENAKIMLGMKEVDVKDADLELKLEGEGLVVDGAKAIQRIQREARK